MKEDHIDCMVDALCLIANALHRIADAIEMSEEGKEINRQAALLAKSNRFKRNVP